MKVDQLELSDVAYITLLKIYSDVKNSRLLKVPEKRNELCIKILKSYLKNPKCKKLKSSLRKLLNDARKGTNVAKKLDAIVTTSYQEEKLKSGETSDIDYFWQWIMNMDKGLGIAAYAASRDEITQAIKKQKHNCLLVDIDDIENCFDNKEGVALIRPILITLFHLKPHLIIDQIGQNNNLNIQAKIVSKRVDIIVAPKTYNTSCPKSYHKLPPKNKDECEHNGSERLLQLYSDLETLGLTLKYYNKDECVEYNHAYVLQNQDFDSFDENGEQIEPYDIVISLNNERKLGALINYLKNTPLFFVYLEIKHTNQHNNDIVVTARLNPSFYKQYAFLLPSYCKL